MFKSILANMFIMKVRPKLFLVTTLWIITLAILVIDLTTSAFRIKPSYYCSGDECNVIFDYFMPNCIDSIVTGDNTETLMTFDINNLNDICSITWTVDKSSISDFKEGDSMTCNMPMDLMRDKEKYANEFLDYCEGSFKDKMAIASI